MLTVVSEELLDVPFYYRQDKLCSLVRATSARLVDFRSAILNAGYRVSLSHACRSALKTDAPNQFVFDMLRAWERLHPTNRDKLDKDSVAWKLLNADPIHTDVSLSYTLLHHLQTDRIRRYFALSWRQCTSSCSIPALSLSANSYTKPLQ